MSLSTAMVISGLCLNLMGHLPKIFMRLLLNACWRDPTLCRYTLEINFKSLALLDFVCLG